MIAYKKKLEQVVAIYEWLKETAKQYDGKPLRAFVNKVNTNPDLKAELDSEITVVSHTPYKTVKRWCLRITYNKWGMKTTTPTVVLIDLLVVLFIYDCEAAKTPIMKKGILNVEGLLTQLDKQSRYFTQQLPKVISDIETGELRLAEYKRLVDKAETLKAEFSDKFKELHDLE